jgi:uncharacterized membrane protein YbhN (UPF0104 family)
VSSEAPDAPVSTPAGAPRRGWLRRLLWALAGLACFAGALAAVLRSFSGLDSASIELRWPPLAGATLLFAASFLYSAWLWHDFLRLAGAGATADGDPGSTRRADAATWLISQLGKYVPGHVVLFAIRLGRSRARTAAVMSAVAYEAVFYLAAALAFAAPAAAVLSRREPTLLDLAPGLLPLAILLIAPGWWHHALCWLLVKLRRAPLDAPPPDRAAVLRLAVRLAGFWLLAGTSFWLFLAAITEAQPWLVAAAAIAAAWAAGNLALPVPGGVGVREAGMVVMLAPVLGPETAAVVAVAHRAWLTLAEILVSLGGFLILRRRRPAA